MKPSNSKIYLYHGVPIDMRNNILYPLNSLKELHVDLYTEKVRKYEN